MSLLLIGEYKSMHDVRRLFKFKEIKKNVSCSFDERILTAYVLLLLFSLVKEYHHHKVSLEVYHLCK